MTDKVLSERRGGVLWLTLNDPDALNALSAEMTGKLVAELEAAAVDPEVRAVVVTGAGRGFCAGGNVKTFGAGSAGSKAGDEQRVNQLLSGTRASILLHTMPKPTIAMVRGPAAGAGLSIALSCDFRVASSTVLFTTAFGRIGLSGDYGGSYFLPRLVGPTKAREMYFLSGRIEAAEALELGLVSKVVDDDKLEAETEAFVARFTAMAPIAMARQKQNLLASMRLPMEDTLALEAQNMVRCFRTEDHIEGVAALREKRAPGFKGA